MERGRREKGTSPPQAFQKVGANEYLYYVSHVLLTVQELLCCCAMANSSPLHGQCITALAGPFSLKIVQTRPLLGPPMFKPGPVRPTQMVK
jgi:hypothetical protein